MFPRIFDATGGIPRRINQLCNRLLLAGYLSEKHLLTLADAEEVVRELSLELSADAQRAPVVVLPGAQRGNGEPIAADFASLAATVERMASNIDVVLDLLQSIVRPAGHDKKGSKSERQSVKSGGSSGG
jgi:hypothetical protein